MYFDDKIKLIKQCLFFLSLLLGVSQTRCGGEDESFFSPPVIEMKSTQCLKKVDHYLSAYLEGQLSEKEVHLFWDCVDRAFQMFITYTQGREKELYSAKELRHFLQTFFLGDIKINDILLEELMRVKCLFLSGSSDYITTKELNNTLKIFKTFRNLTINLLPHIQTLRGQFDPLFPDRWSSLEDLNYSLKILSEGIEQIAEIITLSGKDYELSHFQILIEELHALINQKKDEKKISFIRDAIPILANLKNYIVGSPPHFILSSQWKRLSRIIDEMFNGWIRYKHFTSFKQNENFKSQAELALQEIKKVPIQLGQLFAQTDRVLEWTSLENLLETLDLFFRKYYGSSSFKKWKEYIPFVSELKIYLVGHDRIGITPSDWSLLTIRVGQMIDMGFRWFYFIVPFNWSKGFGLEQLDQLVTSFIDLLKDGVVRQEKQELELEALQRIIAKAEESKILPFRLKAESLESILPVLLNRLLQSPKVRLSQASPKQALQLGHINYVSEQWRDWVLAQKFSNDIADGHSPSSNGNPVLTEVLNVVTAPWPLITDHFGRLIFRSNKELKWDQWALTKMNLSRGLLRLLLIGFSEEETRANQGLGLTHDELGQLSQELFSLAVDIGLFGPEDNNIWERIFIESDLFMPQSNGDEMVNLVEAIDYLHFVLSGIEAGDRVLRSLPSDCIINTSDSTRVDTPCFRDHLDRHQDELMAHVPYFLAFRKKISSLAWTQVETNLEIAVRGNDGPNPSIPIKISDIKEMLILVQYIETFFLRFNQDQGQDFSHINLNEALSAFSVYDLPLLRLLGLGERTEREAVFTYMIKHCRPPVTEEDFLELGKWKNQRQFWQLDADRSCLVSVLSELAKSL